MQKPLEFTISVADFITYLLPEESSKVGTDKFKTAVVNFYARQFAPLGGNTIVGIDDESINVQWIPDEVAKDPFAYVLDLLSHGELAEAVPLLESFLAADPDDIVALYNLGMAQSDLGKFDDAVRHLSRLVELEPDHVNGLVALGVAYQRSRESDKALEILEDAVALDPDNGFAHRNLGAVLATLHRTDESARHLRAAYQLMPQDQASVYGLAKCLEESADEEKISESDELYVKAIRLDQVPQITELAKQARNRLAQRSFSAATAGGPRMDAVMYCLSALQKFAEMDAEEVRGVAFEIAMLGKNGLDTKDSTPKYKIRSLPGTYTGLQLVSMMFVGFKQIEPTLDLGFDLSKEYETAQQLFGSPRAESKS